MIIEKTFEVNAPQKDVWEFITTPEKVAECVPGCQDVEELGNDKYKAGIKVQVGPIKTIFNVNVEATEQHPPCFASYLTTGHEGGRASRINATTELHLNTINELQTEVLYRSDIKIMGRLGKFGEGIMKKKADAIGGEFVEALRSKLDIDTIENRGIVAKPAELSNDQAGFRNKVIASVLIALGVAIVGYLLFVS